MAVNVAALYDLTRPGLRGVEGCGLVVGGDAGCQQGGGGVSLQEGRRVGKQS
jgi:hypothetical protein